ncbi:MAG: FkbM family methyltransferase [Bacteroidota bacterium]|nr:FkbM family methyltransferase [Bacteroidota bacterium]MDP3144771.1 FkbM family methyltransferase [Bacteroidota bacterium]MDP3557858.1 FkbM family methyltransferase [Bacteroidota bacterium]
MFNSWLPVTKIKIFGAKILYKVTTLFVGKQMRVIDRDGVKYEVDLAEGIELSLFLFGKFQSHITKNSFLTIANNYTIIDIGANVGLMTLQFAKLANKGKVYSFEPTFYALERLKKNLSLNPELAKNVTVINSFVSESSNVNPDIVAYSSWKVNGERGSNDHPVHLGTPKNAEGVPSISLNDFVENEKLEKIDFIKIDTDGHEYEVFKGADKAIAKYRPKIIFEIGLYVMDEKNISFDFYYEYFKKLNYKLVDTKTEKEVNLTNYKKYIPMNGSTDLIALPL